LGLEIEAAGPEPEVVLEATWGWYWAADVVAHAGGRVHLAHPLGIAGFENRRVKNDRVDARLLADLLRRAGCRSLGSHRSRSVISGSWSATAGNRRSCGPV
jgi:transposase